MRKETKIYLFITILLIGGLILLEQGLPSFDLAGQAIATGPAAFEETNKLTATQKFEVGYADVTLEEPVLEFVQTADGRYDGKLSINVLNLGQKSAKNFDIGYRMVLSIDGTPWQGYSAFGNVHVRGVRPGDSERVVQHITYFPEEFGDQLLTGANMEITISLIADSNQEVKERNEDNNQLGAVLVPTAAGTSRIYFG